MYTPGYFQIRPDRLDDPQTLLAADADLSLTQKGAVLILTNLAERALWLLGEFAGAVSSARDHCAFANKRSADRRFAA